MKIGTKLRWAVVIPLAMALLVIGALVFSFAEMNRIQNNGSAVRDIRSSITDLNHTALSYILYHEDRPKEQFAAQYTILSNQISGTGVKNLEQQNLLNTIRQDVDNMNDLFFRLVANYEANPGGETAQSQQTASLLVGLLLSNSFEADTDAAQLRGLIDSEVTTTEIRTFGLILAVLLLALIPMGLILFRIRSSIISSVSRLGRGAEAVGAGHLDYQFNEASPDEIGELSHSLNKMTSNLKTVTASKADLEKEIAERAKIQEALSQSEQRLRRLYESGMMGVMYWNTDGQIEDANDKFLDMTGYTREDLKAGLINWINLTPPEYRSRDERSLAELKSEGVNKSPFEKEYIRKDGTRMPIIISGAMLDKERFHGVAFVLDISEHKKAEEALKESEAKANALIKYAPTGIYEIEFRGPSFVNVNDAMCSLSGYSREEFLAMVPESILEEESRKVFADRIRRQLAGELIDETVEYRIRKKDGSLMFVVLQVSFPKDKPGTAFVIGHDVTDRKKTEESLKRYARELEAHKNHLEEMVSQRTRELQSLSYRLIMVQEEERSNISRELHDQIGQSLTVTNLLLAKSQRSPETSKDDLKEAQQTVKEVLSQVRNLSSSLHPGMLEDLGLIATMNWYLNDFSKKSGIKTDFDQSGFEGTKLRFDLNITIYRIIQEALTNIARYAEVNEAAISLQLKDSVVTIKVQDKGKGFNPESQAQGVGLRGMRERVNALKGKLSIQSAPGQGTVIKVELPITEETSPKN